MNTLPTELAHHIFSFLPRSSLFPCLFVNHLWHDYSQARFYEKVYWPASDKLDALLTTFTLTQKVKGGLGRYVKRLNIMINLCDWPTPLLSKILLLCPNIEDIYIHYHYEGEHGGENSDECIPLDLALSLASCTKLRALKCYGLIPLSAVDGTGCNFPSLTYLELRACVIKVATLEELAIHCPNLDELHLMGNVQGPITDAQSLNITMSSISTISFGLNDLDSSWVTHLALRYPKLKRLSTLALWLSRIDHIDFRAFAQSCSSLSDIVCLGGYAPKASFLEILSRTTAGETGLQKLNVQDTLSFTDQDLHKAAICFGQSLCSLILRDCDSITSDGLHAAFGSCPNLTNLYLFPNNATWELRLPELISHCPKIEAFKLIRTELTCASSSMHMSNQTHLKKIELQLIPTWPAVLDYISAYCPNVSQIDLLGLYMPGQDETCIVNLENHHIRELLIQPFYDNKKPKEDCQYLIKLTDGFQSNMIPRTRWLYWRDFRQEYHLFLEPEDAVSKFVNLEIRIGQLDKYETMRPDLW